MIRRCRAAESRFIVTKGAVLRNPLTRLMVPVLVFALASCAPQRQPQLYATSSAWSSAFPGADTVRVDQVANGVEHIYAWQKQGPWAVHVIAIDRQRCDPRIAVAHAGPPLTASAGVSDIARAGASSREGASAPPALAAINADFFAIPAGTPGGAQVSGGVVQVGPGRRPIFAISRAGYWIDVARIDGSAGRGADTVPIGQVNRPRAGDAAHPATDGLTMFTEWWGRPTALDSGAVTLGIRIVDGTASQGRGVVTVVSRAAGVAIGRGRIALTAGTATGAGMTNSATETSAWLSRRVIGDTIRWRVDLVTAHDAAGVTTRAALEATGAFPALLHDGNVVTDAGELVRADFGPARHPRTAIGWTRDAKHLLLVTVDGRQPPYSDGMALAELTTLFQRLGATDAINLDGGGSTTMVVNGRIVNRVSDRPGERAVGNAIVLQECQRK